MVSALLIASLLAQAPANPHASVAAYVPERVYDTARGTFADFEVMLADLAKADAVFVGEQHGDPNTHRLEAAILQGLLRRGVTPTVSLEMFERDAQGALDAYLAGEQAEEAFLAASRPWPRYATDYRPLVEMARAHQWRVIAANVPRRLAQDVAKSGEAHLESLPEEDRPLVAADLECPQDAYFDRFVASMGSHPVAGEDKAASDERMSRYYWSQCLKDETMAESIAAAAAAARGPIVHYNGAFHSDFGHGTAERLRRRLHGARTIVVSILPVDDLDTVVPSPDDLRRADYLVYTAK